MCCGSEAGSYLRLIDFVYHSTLGLRVIKKKKMPEVKHGTDGRNVTHLGIKMAAVRSMLVRIPDRSGI